MREGTNPNRKVKVKGYAPVVISAITHLPNYDGYHSERLEVVKCSLETMRDNAGADCEIMIWDNGSAPGLTHWLKRSYKPDYLILSPNVGKSIARASMVRMLPPDTIVGVADDDMFYYPDWLAKQLNVYHTYPNVGTVSGWPVRTQFRFCNSATVRWGRRYASRFERGRFISAQEDKDFCTSIGRDYKYQLTYTRNDIETKLTFRGVEAYATGHHAQWIGRAGTMAAFVEYSDDAMADERPFEQAINHAGLLRLTTVDRTTQHIGNILDKKLEELWQN